MSQIKAIETSYNGYRFRSRLEARWAVFFDTLDVEWEYEKEGFDLGKAGCYLPDFWLPNERLWFEVKGAKASDEERAKCQRLSWEAGAILLAEGNIGDEDLTLFCFDIGDSSGGAGYWECRFLGTPNAHLYIDGVGDRSLFRDSQFDDLIPDSGWLYRAPLRVAYNTARSARFEHGEKPLTAGGRGR